MENVLELQRVTKHFPVSGDFFVALEDVSLQIETGTCLGLIGESGSGKSTLAKIVSGILAPTGGRVLFMGRELPCKGVQAIRARTGIQMIFQSPFSSFNPRMTMQQSLTEALRYGTRQLAAKKKLAAISDALEEVRLNPKDFLRRRPSEMSGGECQRAAIARALLCNPKLLICDEITSALDVSIQAQIIRLLVELQRRKGLTVLFISHDIALVSCIADQLAILQAGKLCETGTTADILAEPKHPYTRQLIRFASLDITQRTQ